jgi:hypothetical protein
VGSLKVGFGSRPAYQRLPIAGPLYGLQRSQRGRTSGLTTRGFPEIPFAKSDYAQFRRGRRRCKRLNLYLSSRPPRLMPRPSRYASCPLGAGAAPRSLRSISIPRLFVGTSPEAAGSFCWVNPSRKISSTTNNTLHRAVRFLNRRIQLPS